MITQGHGANLIIAPDRRLGARGLSGASVIDAAHISHSSTRPIPMRRRQARSLAWSVTGQLPDFLHDCRTEVLIPLLDRAACMRVFIVFENLAVLRIYDYFEYVGPLIS